MSAAGSGSRLPTARETWTSWREPGFQKTNELEHISYGERLKDLKLFSLGK